MFTYKQDILFAIYITDSFLTNNPSAAAEIIQELIWNKPGSVMLYMHWIEDAFLSIYRFCTCMYIYTLRMSYSQCVLIIVEWLIVCVWLKVMKSSNTAKERSVGPDHLSMLYVRSLILLCIYWLLCLSWCMCSLYSLHLHPFEYMFFMMSYVVVEWHLISLCCMIERGQCYEEITMILTTYT